jgi:DNA-binding response OmpR family regulator
MEGGKPIIVVADDDRALRMLCRVNLELEGYDVIEAASGAEVEKAVAANDVSLILLDVHFGADNGIELAGRLREAHPDLPLAFLTGSVTGPIGRGVVDGYISKPFTLEQLGDLARDLVPGRPAARG